MLEKPVIPWLLVEVMTNPDPIIATKPFNLSIRAKMEEGEHFQYEAEISFTMVSKITPAHINWLAADMGHKSLLPEYICRKMLIEGMSNPFKKLPYVIEPSDINDYYDGVVPELFPMPDQVKLTRELSDKAQRLPGMHEISPPCPQCGKEGIYLSTMVIHMNDTCCLTREQIAYTLQEWHDQGLVNIAFTVGEPHAEH